VKQMTEWFDFEHVGRTSGVWNPEKLTWLNQQYLKTLPVETIAQRVSKFLESGEQVKLEAADPRLLKLTAAFRERSKTLVELAQKAAGYFKKGVKLDAEAAAKHLDANGKAALLKAAEALQGTEWAAAKIDEALKKLAEGTGLKMGAIAQPIRVAVTGGTTSPGIGETLELLGRDEALARIAQALK
jgi:glutamyl-tRNA synthetase